MQDVIQRVGQGYVVDKLPAGVDAGVFEAGFLAVPKAIHAGRFPGRGDALFGVGTEPDAQFDSMSLGGIQFQPYWHTPRFPLLQQGPQGDTGKIAGALQLRLQGLEPGDIVRLTGAEAPQGFKQGRRHDVLGIAQLTHLVTIATGIVQVHSRGVRSWLHLHRTLQQAGIEVAPALTQLQQGIAQRLILAVVQDIPQCNAGRRQEALKSGVALGGPGDSYIQLSDCDWRTGGDRHQQLPGTAGPVYREVDVGAVITQRLQAVSDPLPRRRQKVAARRLALRCRAQPGLDIGTLGFVQPVKTVFQQRVGGEQRTRQQTADENPEARNPQHGDGLPDQARSMRWARPQ